jgi:hypothetical protein
MGFSVACECGNRLPVAPAMCGSTATCACGRRLQLPSLSELRVAAGLSAFEVSIRDRVKALGLEGRLPTERGCVVCARQTRHSMECLVECERPWVKAPGFGKAFLLFLFSPILAVAQLKQELEDHEVHGRESVVRTPIRICQPCFESARVSKRRCLELLRKTELYGQLLDAYPKAAIHWETQLRG